MPTAMTGTRRLPFPRHCMAHPFLFPPLWCHLSIGLVSGLEIGQPWRGNKIPKSEIVILNSDPFDDLIGFVCLSGEILRSGGDKKVKLEGATSFAAPAGTLLYSNYLTPPTAGSILSALIGSFVIVQMASWSPSP
eukprot:1374168-Amorphochlora_amoeboformis.AAC.2